MISTRNQLARKYARAFLNVYNNELSSDYFSQLRALQLFLKKNKWLYHYLAIASIETTLKEQSIHQIVQTLGQPHHTELLMTTLLKANRIEILDIVVDHLLDFYEQDNKIEKFTITTSHALNNDDQERVKVFISSLTTNTITATFLVDKSLICGIKIQSNQSSFERSIAHQLKNFEKSLLQRVSL